MIFYVKGNLLGSSCDYICHQVNCQGVMGAGLAAQIRTHWPNVYEEYKTLCEEFIWNKTSPLGMILISETKDTATKIVSMFGQDGYGRKGRYTSYDAFWSCLGALRNALKPGETVAFPKGIGCGLGGANWEVIRTMIEEVLKDFNVYIYERSEG